MFTIIYVCYTEQYLGFGILNVSCLERNKNFLELHLLPLSGYKLQSHLVNGSDPWSKVHIQIFNGKTLSRDTWKVCLSLPCIIQYVPPHPYNWGRKYIQSLMMVSCFEYYEIEKFAKRI